MSISLKGIVEPTAMNLLCDKIRILLESRKNVPLASDYRELRRYTTLMRCFTICERDHIESCFMGYQCWKRKQSSRQQSQKEVRRYTNEMLGS